MIETYQTHDLCPGAQSSGPFFVSSWLWGFVRCCDALLLTFFGVPTAARADTLLLAGLWTPVVGTLVAVIEMWTALTRPGDPWISIVLATLGVTGAMIGPGAWSLDARLFGRKHIST